MLLLLLLVAGVTNTLAQDVTIRGNNGSCVAAVKNGGKGDTFFRCGGFATWQHEQLQMVLTTSDGTALTPNGQLDNPANNLFVSQTDTTKMQIAKGQFDGRDPYTGENAPANVCYVSLSLPKGYRFTSYTITFTRPAEVNIGTDEDGDAVYLNPTRNHYGSSGYGNYAVTFGETGNNFNTYTTSASIAPGGNAVTITRTEGAGGTMGNVLYFKLESADANHTNIRSMIQLETAKFYFTSEENFSPVTPAGDITTPVSAVKIPFPTSKVDFGRIWTQNYQGVDRVSYSSANVKDLEGHFMLYEDSSTVTGYDIDSIQGKIVAYNTGSQYTITSAGGYFKLGSGNTSREKVYYLEAPSNVEVSSGVKVPVGYRITGAEIEYATSVTASRTFRIRKQYDGTWYYLNTDGHFSTTQITWEMDGEGYISTGSGTTKQYLIFNNGYAGVQTGKPASSERFGINSDNVIYQLNWPDYTVRCNRVQTGQHWEGSYWSGQYVPDYSYTGMISNTTGDNASYQQVQTSSASVQPFILKVYDKTGESLADSIRVTGNGIVKLNSLNNDAIKFGVMGTGLVRATLTLQALDPYLKTMEVVCNDLKKPQIKIKDTFTASDFSVSGGEFYFYLPADCAGDSVRISFENLQSDYFDDTYPGGKASSYSRLNFVKSDHYNAFNSGNENVIYTDTLEAKNASLERRIVNIGGTKKFRFNNAGDVGEGFEGTVEEYAFSLGKYAREGGSFDQMFFAEVTDEDSVMTRYIFTTDETRYNIAPTTAIQHRAYAFYEMIVHVQSSLYEPVVTFVPIYNKTLNANQDTLAYYGAVVTADAGGKPGYSSTQEVFKIMDQMIADSTITTQKPASHSQLLYIDFSRLKGVYEVTDSTHQSMEDYSATNAPNCLIFLPEGHGAPNNNVAAKIGDGLFRSAHNIVLTDMEPFYTPYDIQLGAEDTVVYKRRITTDKYGKVKNASLILPFIVSLENGKHTNLDGTTFSLHTMKAGNALTNVDDEAYAYFPELSDVTTSEANTPYLVKLEENSGEPGMSFVVTQKGSTIYKTPEMGSDYTIAGAASSGTYKGTTYNFTPKGTYAGQRIKRTSKIFYFADDEFVNSEDCKYEIIKAAPFRAYFSNGSSPVAAKLARFGIIFGDGEGDAPTGINSLGVNADLMVIPGDGIITMTSTIEQNVRVYSTSGVLVNNAKLQAGETQTVNVPAGVYVINGVKIMVK